MYIKRTLRFTDISSLALCLYIVSIFAFTDVPIVKNFGQLALFSAGFLALFSHCRSLGKVPSFYFLWAFSWLMICFSSILWSVNPKSSMAYFISVLQVVLIGIIFFICFTNQKSLEKVFSNSIILAAIFLIIRLLISTPLNEWGSSRLGLNLGMNVNSIAANFLIAEAFAFYGYLKNKKNNQLILSILFVAVIIMCASKKAMVMCVVFPVVLYVMNEKAKNKNVIARMRKYILGVLILILIVYVFMQLPAIYIIAQKRMDGMLALFTTNGTVDKSTEERLLLSQAAIKVFMDNPILGVGLNGFRYASGLWFRGSQLYAHNNYLELLSDLGIIGTCIFYALPINIVRLNIKNFKTDLKKQFILLLIAIILIMDFARVTYYVETINILFVFFLFESKNKERIW